MSWAPCAFSLKMPDKRAYCTTHTCVYPITRWSSRLDYSKFSHRDMYEKVWEISWIKYFFIKLHLKCIKMCRERLLLAIVTLHHLFYGHCVNWEVIVLDRSIFLRERKKMVRSYYCLNKIYHSKDSSQWSHQNPLYNTRSIPVSLFFVFVFVFILFFFLS